METMKFGKNSVAKEEFLAPGHSFCAGCGESLAIRLVTKALGKNEIITMATGCSEVTTTPFPYTSWQVPWIHTLFENVGAVVLGVEAASKILMKKGKIPQQKIHYIGMGGDGATLDIGLQSLSGAFERGHDFMYLCLDNEGYMNTGVQRSSSTPYGASTTTAPAGKISIGETKQKKNMVAIAAAHEIPYIATACPSYPFDLLNKVKKGAEIKGPTYLHILCPCPNGWQYPAKKTIELGRLAVETGVFPLYEIENGHKRLTVDMPKLKPVEYYLKPQGRFRHLPEPNIEEIQERVHSEYALLSKASRTML